MKNTNNLIGNGTRGLPACSTLPQPTAPPRIRYLLPQSYKRHKRNVCAKYVTVMLRVSTQTKTTRI